MTAVIDAPIARIVPGRARLGFLRKWVGRHALSMEMLTYAYANRLSTQYTGGVWNFYTTSNGARFMAPNAALKAFATSWPENWYEGELSPEAFGIVASLFSLCRLANETDSDDLAEAYHLLRDFAAHHPERAEILRAID